MFYKWCPRCHSGNVRDKIAGWATFWDGLLGRDISTGEWECQDCGFAWNVEDYYYDYRERDYVLNDDDDDDDDDDDESSNTDKNRCYACGSLDTVYFHMNGNHRCNKCGHTWR